MMEKESDIQDWFADDLETDQTTINEVVKKTRRAVGQKDTLELVFVKIWTAMAELLAPLFANAARTQGEMSRASKILKDHAAKASEQQKDNNQ